MLFHDAQSKRPTLACQGRLPRVWVLRENTIHERATSALSTSTSRQRVPRGSFSSDCSLRSRTSKPSRGVYREPPRVRFSIHLRCCFGGCFLPRELGARAQ